MKPSVKLHGPARGFPQLALAESLNSSLFGTPGRISEAINAVLEAFMIAQVFLKKKFSKT
jgi:hypothetical protein